MIKGIGTAILAALFVTVVVLVILHFFEVLINILIWITGIVIGGIIVAAVIFFIIVFIFAVIVFFALFYFLAEKKPNIKPGNYKLEEEKGKNE